MERGAHFVQCSDDETLGNLIDLVNNSFEPILVYQDEGFKGLISIQNTFYHSRMPYLSKAINQVSAGTIYRQDRITKAVKEMVDYGWYRIPVFDQKKQIVGQLTAAGILKVLMANETFHNLIMLRTPIKKAILVPNEASIKEAFQALADKKNNYAFLIDKESHFRGVVSKKSLLKAFNQKAGLRLEAIPGWKGFVGEKIDRADYPLQQFVEQKIYETSGTERENKERLVTGLVNSGAHYVAVLNEENYPTGILELRDLLETVLVRDKTGPLPLQLRGFEEVRIAELRTTEVWIASLYEHISKSEKISQIALSKKEDKNFKGKVNAYEIMLKIDLYSGKMYIAHSLSRKLLKGIREVIDEIKKQASRD